MAQALRSKAPGWIELAAKAGIGTRFDDPLSGISGAIALPGGEVSGGHPHRATLYHRIAIAPFPVPCRYRDRPALTLPACGTGIEASSFTVSITT